MLQKVNYHTHSHYCDGKGALEDYVTEAINNNFSALGFSGHAPLPFDNNFSIRRDDFADYCAEINLLKEKYAGKIKILLGLEIDYIPGIFEDFSGLMTAGNLDYCIGSVHLVNNDKGSKLWMIDGSRVEIYDNGLADVFGGDIKKGVTAFYQQTIDMIRTQSPTIIGHLNKIEMNNKNRYFHADEPWYVALVDKTLEEVALSGCICEINTRGIYKKRYDDFYPSKSILLKMNELDIPVVVSSDAHQPSETGLQLEEAYRFLDSIHYRNVKTWLFK